MNNTAALVLKIQDPDALLHEKHEAFSQLVHTFQDMAYSCAYSRLGDFQHSEDVAQEAFVTAWQKISQLREPAAFPGWFKRILLTSCNRLTRRKQVPLSSLEDIVDSAAYLDSPQSAIESKEAKRVLFAAISALPQNDRLAVILFYLNQYSHREIAALLEVPTTTVAKRLYSARTRLAESITKDVRMQFLAHRPSRNDAFERKVAAGIFDEYVGEYVFEARPDLRVQIQRHGKKLVSRSNGQRNELAAVGKSTAQLKTKEFDGRGRFFRDAKGQISHFVYFEFGREMGIARKIV